jgi:hypothetical protein
MKAEERVRRNETGYCRRYSLTGLGAGSRIAEEQGTDEGLPQAALQEYGDT